MANNCSYTKLMAEGNNDNLPFFDAFTIEVLAQTTPVYSERNFNVVGNANVNGKIKVISGDIHFTNSSGSSDLGQSIDLSQGSNDVYVSNGAGVVLVENKSNITSISMSYGHSLELDVSNIDFIPSLYLTGRACCVGTLPQNTNFTYLQALDSVNLKGVLLPQRLSNATTIAITNTKLRGNLSSLGSATTALIMTGTNVEVSSAVLKTSNLTIFNARNCVNVTGNTSDLANGKMTDVDIRDAGITGSVESYCEEDYGRTGNVSFAAGVGQTFNGTARATTYYISFASGSVTVKQTNSSGAVLGTYNGSTWTYA